MKNTRHSSWRQLFTGVHKALSVLLCASVLFVSFGFSGYQALAAETAPSGEGQFDTGAGNVAPTGDVDFSGVEAIGQDAAAQVGDAAGQNLPQEDLSVSARIEVEAAGSKESVKPQVQFWTRRRAVSNLGRQTGEAQARQFTALDEKPSIPALSSQTGQSGIRKLTALGQKAAGAVSAIRTFAAGIATGKFRSAAAQTYDAAQNKTDDDGVAVQSTESGIAASNGLHEASVGTAIEGKKDQNVPALTINSQELPPISRRQNLARAIRTGFLGALAGIIAVYGITLAAQVMGYQLHSNYTGGSELAKMNPVKIVLAASVMAPMAEEMIFRGGIQGGMRWAAQKIPYVGNFLLPALGTSFLFVIAHETADPVLFAGRFVGAMIFSYVYAKQGFAGSMSMHAIYNGIATLPLVLFLVPGISPLVMLPVLGALIALAIGAIRTNRIVTRKFRATGPYRISILQSALIAAALVAGYFFILPTQVWLAGALGWAIYMTYQIRQKLKAT